MLGKPIGVLAVSLTLSACGGAPPPAFGGKTVSIAQDFTVEQMQEAIAATELWAVYGANITAIIAPPGAPLEAGAVPVVAVDGPGEMANWAGIYDSMGVRIDLGVMQRSGYSLRRLFAHEFGHVLGVGHIQVDGDVMCPGPCFDSDQWVLSEADVAGVRPSLRIHP